MFLELLVLIWFAIFMQGYELRIRQMMDELAAVRKTVVERDEAITKLRFEVQTSTRVVSFKVFSCLLSASKLTCCAHNK